MNFSGCCKVAVKIRTFHYRMPFSIYPMYPKAFYGYYGHLTSFIDQQHIFSFTWRKITFFPPHMGLW